MVGGAIYFLKNGMQNNANIKIIKRHQKTLNIKKKKKTL